MKILGFAGSNSSVSKNKKLVNYTISHFNGEEIEVLDLNDYEMPIYSSDRELHDGIPELAYSFARKIDESDLLIVSLAEHNGAYSTAFKNIFDWVSRIKDRNVFNDRPMFLLATSPGARGGSSVLEIAKKRFPFNGAKLIETFSLPSFNDTFTDTNGIINEKLRSELETKIEIVKRVISRHEY